jgi:hypothetical protein
MARVIRFERPEPVGPALRRSLDLADLAERLLLAAGALTAAAGTLTEAHASNTRPITLAFDDAKRAAGDVFVALAEFSGNAALRQAREEASEPCPVADGG